MTHPFMTAVAEGLAERRAVPLHISFPPFPATERCSRRPDRPALARPAPALQTSKMADSGLSAMEPNPVDSGHRWFTIPRWFLHDWP